MDHLLVEATLFFTRFIEWLGSLSASERLLVISVPVLIDFPRSIGKSAILLIHSLYKRIYHKDFDPNYHPKVSLIVPAHNEEASLRKTIEAALEADYNEKEIIVIDDGSQDRTYEYAQPYARNGEIKLFRRPSSSGSKTGALNYGLMFSSGDISIVVDADSLIERRAVSRCVDHFRSPSVGAVSGNVKVLSGDGGVTNLLTELQSYEYVLSFEVGRRFQALTNTLVVSPGAFTCFRTKVGQQLGLFDVDTITEDFDFSIKLRKAGYKIEFASSAIVWTYCPSTWSAWFRQRKRWAYGQIATLRKHLDLFRKYRYKSSLVLAVYDMLVMDILLLIIRGGWFASLAFFYPSNLIFASLLALILYLTGEVISITTAGLLSTRRQDLKKIYLAPLIVFFYRPLYSIVRLLAYIKWYRNRKVVW